MPCDNDLVACLREPPVAPAFRELCRALTAPEPLRPRLRAALSAFVRHARSRSLALGDVLLTLRVLLRDCEPPCGPVHDRSGVSAYVLRRAVLLYESAPRPPTPAV
ncbi:MAG: hypothetical protein ACJ79S_17815 [Gemmatimonadaceae bacterium]